MQRRDAAIFQFFLPSDCTQVIRLICLHMCVCECVWAKHVRSTWAKLSSDKCSRSISIVFLHHWVRRLFLFRTIHLSGFTHAFKVNLFLYFRSVVRCHAMATRRCIFILNLFMRAAYCLRVHNLSIKWLFVQMRLCADVWVKQFLFFFCSSHRATAIRLMQRRNGNLL